MKNLEYKKFRTHFQKAKSSDEVRNLYIATLNKFRNRYKNSLYDYADQGLIDVVERNNFFLKNIPGEKILDLGCGDGFFSNQLASAGKEVIGVDMIPKRIRLAKQNAKSKNTKFICSTIEKAKLSASYFDTIIISHVLEHAYDPKKILEIALKAAKNQAKIIVVLPPSIGNDPTHIREILPNTIVKELKKIGAVSKRYKVGTKGYGHICKVKK